jgi:phenylpyruvate tautomerase
MPYLNIQTNVSPVERARTELLKEGAALVSRSLGKPEKFTMGAFSGPIGMVFDQNDEAAAFVEVKGLDLTPDKAEALAGPLAELVGERLGVEADRIYVVFTDVPRGMWAWDGRLF